MTSSPNGEPLGLTRFARFCSELKTPEGPLRLYPDQLKMLRDYFAGARESVILLPKKNGKSTLIAALAIYHLLTTEDAFCVVAAAARKQAEDTILRQAKGFIRRHPKLRSRLRVINREIRFRDGMSDGLVVVLASDSDTADGVIPTLAIVDELHRHRTGELYGLLRDGLGPRNGQIITISTAGDDEESPLGQIRSRAYDYGVEKDGAYRCARSPDGSVVLHEWALDPDEDRSDMKVVKKANPAPWHTEERLLERFASPTTTPWQWARFACGVWLQGEDRVVGPVEWSECGTHEELVPPPDAEVRFGMDVAFTGDTTAIVPHWLDGDLAYLGVPRILVPPKDGGLRKRLILKSCDELREKYGGSTIVIDPEAGGQIISQDLEEMGFEMAFYSQKPGPMAHAAELFYAAVRERKLRHPHDPKLTRHVLNGCKRGTDDGRWRFVKESKGSHKHIDGLIAAAMVHASAMAPRPSAEPMAAWI